MGKIFSSEFDRTANSKFPFDNNSVSFFSSSAAENPLTDIQTMQYIKKASCLINVAAFSIFTKLILFV